MPGCIRQTLIVLVLMLCFGGSLATNFISVNNQQCMARPKLIDLNPDECRYYPFIVSIDRCEGSCNTVEDPFVRAFVPNKMEDVNLKVFNMIKRINESKTLTKHVSCV